MFPRTKLCSCEGTLDATWLLGVLNSLVCSFPATRVVDRTFV